MAVSESSSRSFTIEGNIFPVEEMLEIRRKGKQLLIGIPKETGKFENRIGLTPESVDFLVKQGHQVIVEKNAGLGANYTDLHYSESGGQIVDTASEVFKSDIILKIAPFLKEEIAILRKNQVVISAIHLPSQSEDCIRMMMDKKVTAIAFEYLKNEENQYPVFEAMSEISGTSSVMIASEYLSNVREGKGVLLGGITGITPTEVTILGAGTAGESAARIALGLGATVKVFDNSLPKLRKLRDKLGYTLFTSTFHPPVLKKALKSSDVIIGAVDYIEKQSGFVLSEEIVKTMKKGAVLVDISIDQGGCFETSKYTTHGNPVFVKHGVIHYCVPNIPSRVSRTASIAISNIFTPILLEIGNSGGIKQLLKENIGLRNGTYIYNGILTNKFVGKQFNIRAQDINLLMAVF